MTDSAARPADTARSRAPDYPLPRATSCPFSPPPALRELQVETPITKVRLWDGSTPWLITRYEDQRVLLADLRLSADNTQSSYPFVSAGAATARRHGRSIIGMDGPAHARLRRMVSAAFSMKHVEAMRPAIQRIADGLVDDMLAGPRPTDLVEAFALPLPSLAICELLGVPYADHDFFQANSNVLVRCTTPPCRATSAMRRLLAYLDGLLGEKMSNPGDDVLSALAGRVAAGELSRQEAASMAQVLLFAGHDATANMIALGALALLQHSEQLARLRDTDDPTVIARAVEELLRYLTIVQTARGRVALADIEIGGEVIHADDGVLLSTDIGNRDPGAFADPDRLDIGRDANGHVAFGFGVHHCLGQNLARVELQVVCGSLYRRIPTLRLATDPAHLEEIPAKHDSTIYGVYELPVTW